MSPTQTESHNHELLLASWTAWTSVVRRFALHGVHSGEYSRQRYHNLHSSLQTHIDRALDEKSTEANVLHGMKQLSAPWPSVDALASADRKLLKDLMDRCTAIQKTLDQAHESSRRPYTLTALAMLLLLAVFAALMSPGISHNILQRLPSEPVHAFPGFLRTLLRNGPELQHGLLIVCASATVLMITWLVFRPPGRY